MLGVDDELLKSATRRIPRADVAELCVQSLLLPEADNRCGTPADSLQSMLDIEHLNTLDLK